MSQFKIIRENSLFSTVIYYKCYFFYVDVDTFFRILAGISPFLVAFLVDKFSIPFLTSLSVTFEKFNVL